MDKNKKSTRGKSVGAREKPPRHLQQKRRINEVITTTHRSSTNVSPLSKASGSQSTRLEPPLSNIQRPTLKTFATGFSIKENKDPIPFGNTILEIEIKGNPKEWTVEEVIEFMIEADPPLAKVADIFRFHEIDGKAFFLLTQEVMIKYMNVKLGPAVKIINLVSGIKSFYSRKRSSTM